MQTDPIATDKAIDIPTAQSRRDTLTSARKAAAEKLAATPYADNSHDFLYDENGLPS